MMREERIATTKRTLPRLAVLAFVCPLAAAPPAEAPPKKVRPAADPVYPKADPAQASRQIPLPDGRRLRRLHRHLRPSYPDGRTLHLTLHAPGRFTVTHATMLGSPPKKREVLFVHLTGKDAVFQTVMSAK